MTLQYITENNMADARTTKPCMINNGKFVCVVYHSEIEHCSLAISVFKLTGLDRLVGRQTYAVLIFL